MAKKILIGYLIDGKTSGIDTHLMNFYDTLKGEDIQADFLTSCPTEELNAFMREKGARVFSVPSLKRPFSQRRETGSLIKKNHYDAAYFNISESFNCMGAWAAKKAGVEKVVIHSHNSAAGGSKRAVIFARTVLNAVCRPLIGRFGTEFLACSGMAGEWLYSRKTRGSGCYHVVSNAIDTERFLYDPDKAAQIRAEWSLAEDIAVLGHVGNFQPYKNTLYVFMILESLLAKGQKAVLISVGEGPERERCLAYAKEKRFSDSVIMPGRRSDIPELLHAMDLFLLPSLHEGQPISVLEAQCTGLPILMSDCVTMEADMGLCSRLSLKEGPDRWAEKIIELRRAYPRKMRHSPEASVRTAFDRATQTKLLKEYVCP